MIYPQNSEFFAITEVSLPYPSSRIPCHGIIVVIKD
jgi:hypothetical protein